MRVIDIANSFSRTPGTRYRTDGPFSGEEFRETFLKPLFQDDSNESIRILLDGTEGYASSFLEEAFGGLTREFGTDRVKRRIELVSEIDSVLIAEIEHYIEQANWY